MIRIILSIEQHIPRKQIRNMLFFIHGKAIFRELISKQKVQKHTLIY